MVLIRGEPIMLKNVPIMLCRSARKRYVLCSTFVPIMLNIFQLCSSKYYHNNSNFAMISVIHLVIINIIYFILFFSIL